MGQVQTYSVYECSAVCAAVVAGNTIAQLAFPQGTPSGGRGSVAGLLLVRCVATTAVAGTFSLSKCIAAGTLPGSPSTGHNVAGLLTGQGNGGYVGDLGVARFNTDWSSDGGVLPTIQLPGEAPQNELDLLPATIGAGFEWTWPTDEPFAPVDLQAQPNAAPGKGFALINAGAGASPAMLVTMRWMEYSPLGTT